MQRKLLSAAVLALLAGSCGSLDKSRRNPQVQPVAFAQEAAVPTPQACKEARLLAKPTPPPAIDADVRGLTEIDAEYWRRLYFEVVENYDKLAEWAGDLAEKFAINGGNQDQCRTELIAQSDARRADRHSDVKLEAVQPLNLK
jgi:hypothetical protein